ncbi:hypothetical protein OUZ56_032168 [Daphnia magna]|uniref:Uncharacterized protein n=1 Tax=Daphnia magna TaxID=35525 RepID=A0ABQ9ZWE1_9CRUS|nr:hypothetical protein OUZ56_032168 [Daphnia magna]
MNSTTALHPENTGGKKRRCKMFNNFFAPETSESYSLHGSPSTDDSALESRVEHPDMEALEESPATEPTEENEEYQGCHEQDCHASEIVELVAFGVGYNENGSVLFKIDTNEELKEDSSKNLAVNDVDISIVAETIPKRSHESVCDKTKDFPVEVNEYEEDQLGKTTYSNKLNQSNVIEPTVVDVPSDNLSTSLPSRKADEKKKDNKRSTFSSAYKPPFAEKWLGLAEFQPWL